jgi:hypothetical protein
MTMRDWIEQQLQTGLPAFSGTQIAGTVAVKEELINELLAQWLAATATEDRRGVDLSQATRFIKAASVRAETGTVLVNFRIDV